MQLRREITPTFKPTDGESSSDVDRQLEKKIVVEGLKLRNARIKHETRRSGISQ